MLYKIEKDIPLPDEVKKRGRKPVYPIADMEVGDSFFIEVPSNKRPERIIATVRQRCCDFPPQKFKVVRRTENGVSGVRCWRVE